MQIIIRNQQPKQVPASIKTDISCLNSKKHDALQCGFCTPGTILNAYSLLSNHPEPSRQEITDGMEYDLYRCGTDTRIIRRIEEAAERDHDKILYPVSRRDFLRRLGSRIVILIRRVRSDPRRTGSQR